MMRVEAVIFAALQPVKRETLAALIGSDCNLDQLISDIRDGLRAHPYDLVEVAGGYRYLTRPCYVDVIRSSGTVGATMPTAVDLSPLEQLTLAVVGYFQPITRMGIADVLGRPVSRDIIAALRSSGLIATGPRSSRQPGARFTYVTTQKFLALTGLSSLRDLPEIDWFEKTRLRTAAPPPLPLMPAPVETATVESPVVPFERHGLQRTVVAAVPNGKRAVNLKH
jgi:chromosome segregation and condensation protein ScpB